MFKLSPLRDEALTESSYLYKILFFKVFIAIFENMNQSLTVVIVVIVKLSRVVAAALRALLH